MVELKRMSHSKFEDYTRCGEMFRLKRIEKVPVPPMLAGCAGTAFHAWTDAYDMGNDDLDWGTTLDVAIDAEQEKTGYSRDDFTVFGKVDFGWYLEHGLDWCEKYVAWRDQTGWKVAENLPADPTGNTSGIEYECRYRCGDVDVIVRLDRIWEVEDETGQTVLGITDTKTASAIKKSTQLAGQVVGARALGVPVAWACYYNVRKGATEKPDTYQYWNVERLRMLYEQAAYAIGEGFFIPRPSDDCFMCSVKRSCLFAI